MLINSSPSGTPLPEFYLVLLHCMTTANFTISNIIVIDSCSGPDSQSYGTIASLLFYIVFTFLCGCWNKNIFVREF